MTVSLAHGTTPSATEPDRLARKWVFAGAPTNRILSGHRHYSEDNEAEQRQVMSIVESAIQGLKKYADFKSRASRQEFWSFLGLVIILQGVAGFVGLLFGVGPLLSGIVSALLII